MGGTSEVNNVIERVIYQPGAQLSQAKNYFISPYNLQTNKLCEVIHKYNKFKSHYMRLLKRQVILTDTNIVSTPKFLKKMKDNLDSISQVLTGNQDSSKSRIINPAEHLDVEE